MSEPYIPVKRPVGQYLEECRSLSRQIKLWREYRGMSKRRLRLLSQVPISRLTEMENSGRADPRYTTILRIAKALQVAIPELLYGSPPDVEIPAAHPERFQLSEDLPGNY